MLLESRQTLILGTCVRMPLGGVAAGVAVPGGGQPFLKRALHGLMRGTKLRARQKLRRVFAARLLQRHGGLGLVSHVINERRRPVRRRFGGRSWRTLLRLLKFLDEVPCGRSNGQGLGLAAERVLLGVEQYHPLSRRRAHESGRLVENRGVDLVQLAPDLLLADLDLGQPRVPLGRSVRVQGVVVERATWPALPLARVLRLGR